MGRHPVGGAGRGWSSVVIGRRRARSLRRYKISKFDSAIQQTGGFAKIAFFMFAIASVAPNVLFVVHRRQQPGDNDSGRIADYFDNGGRRRRSAARDHRSGGEPDWFVHDYRRIIRTDLRSNGGGLLVIGERSGPGLEKELIRRIWSLGSRIRGRILPFLPIPAETKPYLQPAAVYSFVVGFVVYAALAKAGLQPKPVSEERPLVARSITFAPIGANI